MHIFPVKIVSCFLIVLFAIVGAGCGSNGHGAKSSDNNEKSAKSKIPTISINGIKLDIEIVQDPDARAQGLMHRKELPENQGMLFVFETTRILSFWMRNTFIPLDIAFIDNSGKIVDIQMMEPLDESKQYTSSAPALYALEVNAGWFKKNGIKIGSDVQF